jgi:hypothetical protein
MATFRKNVLAEAPSDRLGCWWLDDQALGYTAFFHAAPAPDLALQLQQETYQDLVPQRFAHTVLASVLWLVFPRYSPLRKCSTNPDEAAVPDRTG